MVVLLEVPSPSEASVGPRSCEDRVSIPTFESVSESDLIPVLAPDSAIAFQARFVEPGDAAVLRLERPRRRL